MREFHRTLLQLQMHAAAERRYCVIYSTAMSTKLPVIASYVQMNLCTAGENRVPIFVSAVSKYSLVI